MLEQLNVSRAEKYMKNINIYEEYLFQNPFHMLY